MRTRIPRVLILWDMNVRIPTNCPTNVDCAPVSFALQPSDSRIVGDLTSRWMMGLLIASQVGVKPA